ncbi:MAG: CDGSH iron-sulfur domain-containing protein [Methylophilaceae bacterium]
MTLPVRAANGPFPVEVEKGKSYYWCACGRSKSQPFCDGSHADTDITPIKYVAEDDETVYFCGCKQSGSRPVCDGTHAKG